MNAKETLDSQPSLPYSRVLSQPGNRGKSGKKFHLFHLGKNQEI